MVLDVFTIICYEGSKNFWELTDVYYGLGRALRFGFLLFGVQ
jgi:hypothetical protein